MSIEKRLLKSGEARYDVRLRQPDGSQIRKTFRNKRDAKSFRSKQLTDRDRGSWIDPQVGRALFSEWADEWYGTMLHSWRLSTADRHRIALKKYWTPALGVYRISTITPRQVQAVINGMVGELSPSTIRSYYGTVRSLFGDAVETDVIGRSPCRAIKLPAGKVIEKRVVTPSELHRLAGAIGPEWQLLVYLGGVLGLRFGEAVALRVRDVSLETAELSISRIVSEVRGHLSIGPPKTSTSIRSVVIPTVLVDAVRTHIEDRSLVGDDLLF